MAEYWKVYKRPDSHAALMAYYDSKLQTISVPFESRVVQTRFGWTHLLVCGPQEAPPLVLLHGLAGGSALAWQRLFPALSQNFRIYAPDIIGMTGKSAPVKFEAANSHAYGLWLLDVLYAMGIERADFVSYLSGTCPIIHLANLEPSRLNRVVLMDALGMITLTQTIPPGIKWRYQLFQLIPSPQNARRYLKQVFAPGSNMQPKVFEENVEFFWLIHRHYYHLPPPEPLPEYLQSRLSAPTLLLVGEHNALYPPGALLEHAWRALPGLREAEIVAGASGAMLDEQTEWVSARILRFFRETA